MLGRKRYGVWLLVASHIAIAVPLALHLSIGSDEASSLYSTEGVSFALQNVSSIQQQPPLYFWVLSLWRELSGSIFFARLLSIIFCAAAIWLFASLTGRLLKSMRASLLATAFLALHPITIRASTEIGPYALVILLSVVMLRSWLAVLIDEPAVPRPPFSTPQIAILLAAVAGLYTDLHFALVLVGIFIGFAVTGRWQPGIWYLTGLTVAVLMVGPLVLFGSLQFTAYPHNIGGGAYTFWAHLLTVVLPADLLPGSTASAAGSVRLWIVAAFLSATAVVAGVRMKRLTRATAALGVVSATICAGLFLSGSVDGLQFTALLIVPLVVFLASLICDVYGTEGPSEGWKYAATLASVLVAWFFWNALAGMYPNWSKVGDWRRVAAYIEQNERSGQPVIVFQTQDALALRYVYHGVNRVLPDERFFDFGRSSSTPDQLKERTEFTISKIPQDATEIWLITGDECRRPGTCQDLTRYLDDNFQVADQRAFYGTNLKLLQRRLSMTVSSE